MGEESKIERKNTGRPKLGESEKIVRYYFRCTQEESEIIDTNYKKSGRKNKSEYLRDMVLGEGSIEAVMSENEYKILEAIPNMGNNLNQLAKKMNSGAFTSHDSESLLDLKKRLNLLLEKFI